MPDSSPPGWWRRWGRPALVAGVLVVGLIGIGNAYVLRATAGDIARSIDAAGEHGYAMVLGNRVFPGGVPSAELESRLAKGLEVYRTGHAHRIIVSGLSRPGYDEPRAMAFWLEQRGVPAADVILDLGGYRTAASMADAEKMGIRDLLVVTQAYHLPRSIYLAEHAGIAAVGVAADDTRATASGIARNGIRESTARAEAIVEVALRGVRGDASYDAPQLPSGAK
jgi:SanA protein